MKKTISGLLVVAILMVVMPTVALASCYRNLPQADFDWYINHQGRLVLDATWFKGDIRKYCWDIRDYKECLDYPIEWVDPIESASGDIPVYKTYLQPGRYLVTLTVYDRWGEDSVSRQIEIPKRKRICRISPRVTIEFKLTREEAKTVAKVLFWTAVLIYIFGGSN